MKKMNKQNKIKKTMKQHQSPGIGSRRKDKKGKFVIPTVPEQNQDRKDYLDQRKVEIIQDGDRLVGQLLNMNYKETVIDCRKQQLGLDDNFNETTNPVIKELFEGMLKSTDMLRAELDGDIYTYKTQIREFEKMKDKFINQYNFTEEQVNTLLTGKFDWSVWSDEYDKENTEISR